MPRTASRSGSIEIETGPVGVVDRRSRVTPSITPVKVLSDRRTCRPLIVARASLPTVTLFALCDSPFRSGDAQVTASDSDAPEISEKRSVIRPSSPDFSEVSTSWELGLDSVPVFTTEALTSSGAIWLIWDAISSSVEASGSTVSE